MDPRLTDPRFGEQMTVDDCIEVAEKDLDGKSASAGTEDRPLSVREAVARKLRD